MEAGLYFIFWNARSWKNSMCEQKKQVVVITNKELQELKEAEKLKENVKLLKWRIQQSNKELFDWIEKNFGLERDE